MFRLQQLARKQTRFFSSSAYRSGRAIIYSQNGDPSQVLSVLTYSSLPSTPLPSDSVNLKFLLSPINPADINVIEGVYPSKPTKTEGLSPSGQGSKGNPVYIGGNEGLAQVIAVGNAVDSLKVNDWVVMTKQQLGTWVTDKNVRAADVLKVPYAEQLTEAQGATLTVNFPTAYNMLSDFVHLQEGDWLVQNGANSAVGQAVIQIAAARRLKTLNLVRNRDNLDKLKEHLYSLGATHILTYEHLEDKVIRDQIKTWTNRKQIRLGLNCVGGKEMTAMSRLLGNDAHLVSYGAMSKQPLSLPTSLFIFKNLTAHGFWQSRWYTERSSAERENLMQNIVALITQGKLSAPENEIVTIQKDENDNVASEKIRSIMTKMAAGRHGKKVLLKFE